DKVAPRYLDRPGGYLRIRRTSQWVLGDGSTKALIGFVGGPEPGSQPRVAEGAEAEKKGQTAGAREGAARTPSQGTPGFVPGVFVSGGRESRARRRARSRAKRQTYRRA